MLLPLSLVTLPALARLVLTTASPARWSFAADVPRLALNER